MLNAMQPLGHKHVWCFRVFKFWSTKTKTSFLLFCLLLLLGSK